MYLRAARRRAVVCIVAGHWACAIFGAAQAKGLPGSGPDYDVTIAVGLDSTGVFRGVKSRKLNPSVYGLMEVSIEDFYGGAYASPVSIAGETSPLLLGYVGYQPDVLGLELNFIARYYAFVGSSDLGIDDTGDGVVDRFGRLGVFETGVSATKRYESGRVSARFFYTPNSLGETDPAYYFNAEVRRDLVYGFELRAHGGVSRYENVRFNEDYADYGVGVYKSIFGFDTFLRYSDTTGLTGSDDRVIVFGIERSFGVASSDRDRLRRFRKIRNDFSLDKSLLSIGR